MTFTRDGVRTSSGAKVGFNRDAAGRITAITAPGGGVIRYEYNAAGELERVTDQAGRYTSFTYLQPAGLTHYLNKVLDPSGHPVAITNYDGTDRLSTVSDALGNITTIFYDEDAKTETKTDPLGGVTKTSYDERGNVLYTVNPIGAISSSTYDANNKPLTVTPPCGCTRSNMYDGNGNNIMMLDALGGITSATYNKYNQLLTKTDPLGFITSYKYDANGNLVAIVDAENNVTTISMDAYGRPLTSTDSTGNTTSYDYTQSNDVSDLAPSRPTRATYPNGTSNTYTYNVFGRIASFTNQAGGVQTFVTDESGMLVEQIDALGKSTSYTYDGRGNLVTITNSLGESTKSEYDLTGHLVRRIEANGGILSFNWDALGRLASTVDSLGYATLKTYRPDGAVEKIRQPDNSIVSFENDTSGRRTAITDPSGNVSKFSYDSNDQVTSKTDPFGSISRYSYDKAGNPSSITDRLGRVRRFIYNGMHRLTGEIWLSSNNQAVKYIDIKQDPNGNILSASDEVALLTMSYNSIDDLVSLSTTHKSLPVSTSFVLTYNFNALDNSFTIIDNDGVRVRYELDERSDLRSLVWEGPGTFAPARVDYSRNSLGDVTSTVRYTDLSRTQPAVASNYVFDRAKSDIGYDATNYNTNSNEIALEGYSNTDSFGPLGIQLEGNALSFEESNPLKRMSRIFHRNASGGTLADYQYTHDIKGQLKTESSASDTTTYTYDPNGQINECARRFQTSLSENFGYDASGNRISAINNDGSFSYTVGSNNRIISNGIYTFEYDLEGNIVSKINSSTHESVLYTYDHRNRLSKVSFHSSENAITKEISYTYDLFNRRIGKTINGEVNQYFYNGEQIWKEINSKAQITYFLVADTTDSWVARQSLAASSLFSGLCWYISDRLGSVRSIVSSDGRTVLSSNEYTVFGSLVSPAVTEESNNFGFNGREREVETGLYYFRARYYDPMLGKFLSEDRFDFDAGDYNLSRYC